jgi:hypothetical protein
LEIPRSLCPPIYILLTEDLEIASPARCSIEMAVYLLLQLRWTTTEIVPLKAAAELRLTDLENILQTKNVYETAGNWPKVLPSVKAGLASCSYPWLLGNIITLAEAMTLTAFNMMFERPLLLTYIHVHQYLLNKGKMNPDDTVESMCKRHPRSIFWNGRPSDESSLNLSFHKWVLIDKPDTAIRVAKARYEKNIALCIGSAGWCIDSNTGGKFGLPKVSFSDMAYIELLKEKLEDSRNHINTFALTEELCKRMEPLQEEVRLALYLWELRNSPDVSKLFGLKVSRLGSCMKTRCTHCRCEEGSQTYSLCGRCRYAAYCSRECQKSGWSSHKEFCRHNA